MTATQQSQLIIEAAGNFLSGKDTNPCGGQLDGQGDAVHPANDRLDRPRAEGDRRQPRRTAQALLRATAGQAGEKASEARERAEESLASLRERLADLEGVDAVEDAVASYYRSIRFTEQFAAAVRRKLHETLADQTMAAKLLRDQIAAIRTRTHAPFNVNFFCHMHPRPNPERQARWRSS